MTNKLKSIKILSVLVSAVVLYSSCSKETTSKLPSDNAALSGKIAVGLYQSMVGSANGFASAAGKANGTSTNGRLQISSYTCGQVVDRDVESTTNEGDTVKSTFSIKGKMVINCTKDTISGYTSNTVTKNFGFNSTQTFDRTINENYTVKLLAKLNAKLGVDGSQVSVIKSASKKTPTDAIDQTNTFTIKGFVIDTTGPVDITSGTADFISEGTNDGRIFSFKGTITFLGDRKAEVAFDGKVVSVDLLTGKTTVK
ncbi:hypothetical protein FPZ43_03895 [Mucilaginibacter pallidiroseus]|uniref:Lipocalin-like domain-containing protein n=1 Tax=Mucilaginibacter pallidiroseus TaxID=2599295 RepID=A0A563UJS5_9SPHI|nr:hypothetical protein [Mucilaginibacter pallidiroseus]TWR31624.1 hypothetical protein FPZ43_03895 [Mucilaginibacter pallidiroseus]